MINSKCILIKTKHDHNSIADDISVDGAGSIDDSIDGSFVGDIDGDEIVGSSDGNADGSGVVVHDHDSGSPGNGSTPQPLVAHDADAAS